MTSEQRGAIAGEWPLNIVQVDRYTVLLSTHQVAEALQQNG